MDDRQLLCLNAAKERDTILGHWQQLASEAPHSYFQSPGWIEAWLDSDVPKDRLNCILVMQDTYPVMGYFLGENQRHTLKILRLPTSHFFEIGDPYYDELTIEYNQPLIAAPTERAKDASSHLIPWLDSHEINARAMSQSGYDFLTALRPQFHLEEKALPSYYVDLALLRENNSQYIDSLSSNKRQQIRRSIKEYEKNGPIEISIAQSQEQAKEMLQHLATLHQKSWNSRGKQGSFSNQYFLDFHRRLIDQRFSHGEIIVAKVATPKTILGYIYGFIYQNEFLFYQSGLNYDADNKLKPGLVSHFYLINYLYSKKINTYDFLLGESDYKRSLANNYNMMYHMKLRKKSLISWVDLVSHRIKHKLKHILYSRNQKP